MYLLMMMTLLLFFFVFQQPPVDVLCLFLFTMFFTLFELYKHTHTFIPRMSPCVLWGPFCLSFSTWNYALSVCSTVRLHACERNKIPRIAPGEQVGTRGGRARYTVQSPRRLGQATENKARPCRCTAADMVLMEKLLINMVEC